MKDKKETENDHDFTVADKALIIEIRRAIAESSASILEKRIIGELVATLLWGEER